MVDNGKSWLATFQVLQGPVEDPQWCYSIWEALWDLHWTAWKGGESRQQRKVGRMLSIFRSDLWNGNEGVVSCFSGIQKKIAHGSRESPIQVGVQGEGGREVDKQDSKLFKDKSKFEAKSKSSVASFSNSKSEVGSKLETESVQIWGELTWNILFYFK